MIKLRPKIYPLTSFRNYIHNSIKEIKKIEKIRPHLYRQEGQKLIINTSKYKNNKRDSILWNFLILEDTMKYIEMLNYLEKI